MNKTMYMAPWCRWLARKPVTLEVDGSRPFGVAKNPHDRKIGYRRLDVEMISEVIRHLWMNIMSDEDKPSLGRNKVLRLGACMLKKLLATLYAVVAQLVEHLPSMQVVARSCLVSRSRDL